MIKNPSQTLNIMITFLSTTASAILIIHPSSFFLLLGSDLKAYSLLVKEKVVRTE